MICSSKSLEKSKNQIPKEKITMTKLRNSIEIFFPSRDDQAKAKMSEPEDGLAKISQSEKQKENRIKRF